MLFAGLTPLAAVEANRIHKDVAGVVPQAERYCRDVELPEASGAPSEDRGAEAEFQLPFAFATNGRPFLRQLRTASGIWFRDLRRAANRSVPLESWYTPQGLRQLARQEIDRAEAMLSRETFAFGFPLRPYQRRAIEAVEAAIRAGQREMLLAMATGTGKTKTCVALIYRLLKTGRFRRVLFLVDREELGIQAGDDFKETRMESLQSFAAIYGIKELGDRVVDDDTRVHITTVQAMARRLLLGDPLVPYEQRVEGALGRILASRSWTKPQRDWLVRIANQTKALTIVDREALDDDALIFRREGGGWRRLDRIFAGELDGVLQQFQREVWAA